MLRDEFRELLFEGGEDLLELCISSSQTPFVFDGDDEAWAMFRERISERLSALPENISIVGSARFGFSQKPERNFRSFSDNSDIDLVVVDAEQFDDLWHRLLRGAYPRPIRAVQGWVRARQGEVYTGWLTPAIIRPDRGIYGPKVDPILQFTHIWFETQRLANSYVAKAHENINARLYRTWEHVRHYHRQSLSQLRHSIVESE